jgi:hypothetical protein
MDGAVCKGQGNEALFRAAVVESYFVVKCHCDWKWLDVDCVNQEVEVVGEAYVGTPVDEGKKFLDVDSRPAIVAKPEDGWMTFDLNNAVREQGHLW